MGEIADELVDSMMDDPGLYWGRRNPRRNVALYCSFCKTQIHRHGGKFITTSTGVVHNCRVATADEFPD